MTLDELIESINPLWQSVVFVIVALCFMYLLKLWRDWRTPFDNDHELAEERNLAVGLRRAGLYVAVAIGMIGALTGPSLGFASDLIEFVIDGVLVVVMLNLARYINDVLVVRQVGHDAAVEQGNVAVGFVEAGSYLATGFILYGSFTGEGGNLWNPIVFFVLGQAVLLIIYEVYQLITSFHITEEIEKGNAAAGLAVGGILTAQGIILSASIAGPFVSWTADLVAFAISALTGIILLLASRKVIDWLFLPHTTLQIEIERDQNVAALALTEGMIIAVALIISAVI
ncbi:MAG: hypothetical protein CL878_05070 [Dehalococcoidia bacterium]|nr:hypothetical protein [Dehalococcoidia bacterium]